MKLRPYKVAEALGIKPETVRQAVHTGRLAQDINGLVSLEAARRLWPDPTAVKRGWVKGRRRISKESS